MAAIIKGVTGAVKGAAQAVFGGKPPQSYQYKMLLIGETGSGKTSFLNLLCNCGLVQALGGFTEGLAQFRNFNDISLENAESRKLESKTSDAKLYNVELGELKVGVIDTPGFGDTRGFKEDEKHTKRIVNALEGEEYINCICLIINGRQARMSATLRYVLTEITSILPKRVLKNVIVVFTNTADPLDLNFDANSLQEYFGAEIEGQRIFFVENPYCRFEKAQKLQGKLLEDKIARSLKRAFEETGDMLTEMCETMKVFKEVHTHHFIELYQKKQDIERKVIDLLAAYNYQRRLEAEITNAEEEANAALKTKTLNDKFRTTQTIGKWKTVTTSDHNTLCGAADCYSVCHESCGLAFSMDKNTFYYCAAMTGNYCNQCGHHYTVHHHSNVRWEREYRTEEFIDKDMKKKFEDAKTMEERARIFKQQLKNKREKSEQERERLSKCLLLTIEEFQELGINRSYAKCLENQLVVVEQHLKGKTGPQTQDLRKTKEEIESKLKVVQKALEQK